MKYDSDWCDNYPSQAAAKIAALEAEMAKEMRTNAELRCGIIKEHGKEDIQYRNHCQRKELRRLQAAYDGAMQNLVRMVRECREAEAALATAIADERERCARVAGEAGCPYVADAIRAG